MRVKSSGKIDSLKVGDHVRISGEWYDLGRDDHGEIIGFVDTDNDVLIKFNRNDLHNGNNINIFTEDGRPLGVANFKENSYYYIPKQYLLRTNEWKVKRLLEKLNEI